MVQSANAQNVEGQPIASEFGSYQVQGTSIGGFSFPPAQCQVTGGGKNFDAFTAGVPVKIVDSNPNLNEVDTPSRVDVSACAVVMSTTYVHYPPYYLTSGTGGLQEAINNAKVAGGTENNIILNQAWHELIAPLSAAAVIASVQGNASWGIEDVTTQPATFYQWGGTQYIAVSNGQGGGPTNYNQGSTGAVTRTSTQKWQDSISIKDFGAVGNGASMAADSAALKAAVAAAATAGQSVFVPAGSYLLDNSAGPAVSGNAGVLIWGEGPGSKLTCETIGASDCIASTGATGFGLENLAIGFGPTATVRSSGYAVDLETCGRCSLIDVALNNGDLSGLRMASSTHGTIRNLRVTNFEANGTFLINNQDLTVAGLTCSNNGDACFETSWFDSEYSAHAVPCDGITASNINSNLDVEAILVNSCTNVSVNGFTSAGSAKEAIFVGQDPTTTTLRWPDRVSIGGGTIWGSGYGTNPLNLSTAQAILVNVGQAPTAGTISHLSFSNIVATHISGWGLQMAEFQNDDVSLTGVTFSDTGSGNSTGCMQTKGNVVTLANVTCTNPGTYSLDAYNSKVIMGSGLVFSGSNQVGSGNQAILLEPTEVGFVSLNGVAVNDTNVSTFASQVYDASSVGLHSIFNMTMNGVVTTVGPSSNNGSTTFTYGDPNHSYVVRNGGQIQSYAPPNFYFLPTAGTTTSSQVNGAVVYYQSKCRATPSSAEQTESIGLYDSYPTLTTESISLNHYGGCSFPITFNLSNVASVLAPTLNDTATLSAQHISGYSSGTYVAAPTFAAGSGAGSGATLSPNANDNDLSGYISVTTGTSPVANATVLTATFGVPYATLAKCSMWPANASAQLLGANGPFIPVPSQTGFSIGSGATPLASMTLFTWGYTCTQ